MTAIPPAQEAAPGDKLIAEVLPRAAALVVAVHDADASTVADLIGHVPNERDRALLVALAALVPDDRNLADLLAWTSAPEFARCCDCGRIKPASDFYKDRTTRTGRARRCKTCDNAGRAERRNRAANKPVRGRAKARPRTGPSGPVTAPHHASLHPAGQHHTQEGSRRMMRRTVARLAVTAAATGALTAACTTGEQACAALPHPPPAPAKPAPAKPAAPAARPPAGNAPVLPKRTKRHHWDGNGVEPGGEPPAC